ncbi:MAG: G-D-S-L family lipolytic protein, partial [Clostridia bacterium]|nr:G-D-S-L family lipolytic protein [Clostridia bacterium]
HELNVRIRQLADDCDVNYIDVPSCLLDYEGNLISEASKDGVHLNKKYSTLWMAYLEQFMFK